MHPKGYVCYRAGSPLIIDGDLTKVAWEQTEWTDDFVDIEGDARPNPRFKTRAKMLWDDDFFYIAAEMEEPHVWATLTEHDSVIFQDNDFEVFIDPDGDNHNYYEIEVNALNTTWDLRLPKPYRDGGPALNEWESETKSAVKIFGTLNDASDIDQGWTLEMAIPWQSMVQGPPEHGDHWRVNFSRVEWQTLIIDEDFPYKKVEGQPEDNWVWSPQNAIDMHRPEMWGYVQFSEKEPFSDRFNVDPYWEQKLELVHFYWAQKEFFKANERYAQVPAEIPAFSSSNIEIETAGLGYTARLRAGDSIVTISEDSRMTVI